MSQRISIFELSERALDETIRKYAEVLKYECIYWIACKICFEIDQIANELQMDKQICSTLCPLYPSKWCRNNRHDSRLAEKNQNKTEWLQDVERYLWWITIELELMRNDYEKHWRGAW